MSYLVYRELLYPLGDWATKVAAVRNEYAKAHKLALRDFKMDWKDTNGGVTAQRTADSGGN